MKLLLKQGPVKYGQFAYEVTRQHLWKPWLGSMSLISETLTDLYSARNCWQELLVHLESCANNQG